MLRTQSLLQHTFHRIKERIHLSSLIPKARIIQPPSKAYKKIKKVLVKLLMLVQTGDESKNIVKTLLMNHSVNNMMKSNTLIEFNNFQIKRFAKHQSYLGFVVKPLRY